MKLNEFADRISSVLDTAAYAGADSSMNGLQVGDINAEVNKVAFAVDASLATIHRAAGQKADVLFVHHGLFWGSSIAITGRHYSRIKTLLDNDLALFACHLPLDGNAVYGNNAQMAKKLGMTDVRPFAPYRGVNVGFCGTFPKPMTAQEIIARLGIRVNDTNFAVNCGERSFVNAGIVSGAGAGDVYAAMDDGLQLLITGESRYTTVNDCLESGTAMLCLGHYETETFGVKAVMEMVEEEMGLETCFIDIPLGL
jgi:dinuclear metal center YbgI/SA1388 family protein